MKDGGADAKERIMNTVVELMMEQKDVSKISNRELAAMANVNSALINYYYQSKENLLNQAVSICMTKMAEHLLDDDETTEEPVQRLKNMLRSISVFAVNYRFLSEIAINGEMKSGNLNTVHAILPLLQEIFVGKSDFELRLKALQVIIPMQVMLLNAAEYKKSINTDILNMENSLKLLDTLVDNIIYRE
jgi:AcrR family transcriptional regulator